MDFSQKIKFTDSAVVNYRKIQKQITFPNAKHCFFVTQPPPNSKQKLK